MTRRLYMPDVAATEDVAELLAQTQPEAAVVHLRGDLGAGKSTLARAWLRALGVTGTVRSPTYTLVEPYPLPGRGGAQALHLDLYRIGDAAELEFLGIDDVPAALWLVEWPERGEGALPPADLEAWLAVRGDGRTCRLEAVSDRGRAWLATPELSMGLHRHADA